MIMMIHCQIVTDIWGGMEISVSEQQLVNMSNIDKCMIGCGKSPITQHSVQPHSTTAFSNMQNTVSPQQNCQLTSS
jgi:hypothetical protein